MTSSYQLNCGKRASEISLFFYDHFSFLKYKAMWYQRKFRGGIQFLYVSRRSSFPAVFKLSNVVNILKGWIGQPGRLLSPWNGERISLLSCSSPLPPPHLSSWRRLSTEECFWREGACVIFFYLRSPRGRKDQPTPPPRTNLEEEKNNNNNT